MLYLAQSGTMDEAASVLGIPRSRAVTYINDMLDIMCVIGKRVICMPTAAELPAIEEGFYVSAGFPGVVGAIDGTLIKIPRPNDYEGWHSRKNYSALNVQAVVDHRGAFRSLTICTGSTNDQSIWNGSGLKRRLSEYVPTGKHLIGDAGYKIWRHLLTPYPEAEAELDALKCRYNKAHSRTRIIVESAFGRLKNRFRVLLGKVELKTTDHRCKLIKACAIIHNFLLDMKDSYSIIGADPMLQSAPHTTDEDPSNPETPISHAQGIARRDDIAAILAGRF